MRFPLLSLLLALAFALVVEGNAEKRVFWGPDDSDDSQLRDWRKSLIERGIEVLSPDKPTLRRKIHAAFPHSPPGFLGEPNQAWILLDGLETGRKYEVRISFSAMQPSTQNLSSPWLSEVWKDPEQKENLEAYLKTREAHKVPSTSVPALSRQDSQQAFFFIGVDPNYFTIDQKMMRDGILVELDFILDPYTFNIIPASAVPISIYLAVLACIAFPLSGMVWRSLQHIARLETETKSRTGDQNKDD